MGDERKEEEKEEEEASAPRSTRGWEMDEEADQIYPSVGNFVAIAALAAAKAEAVGD